MFPSLAHTKAGNINVQIDGEIGQTAGLLRSRRCVAVAWWARHSAMITVASCAFQSVSPDAAHDIVIATELSDDQKSTKLNSQFGG